MGTMRMVVTMTALLEKCLTKQNLLACSSILPNISSEKKQVKFFGMILSRDGVSPGPSKIEALKRLPEPKDEKLLQSFLGMVNYLSRFDPNIANMTHNLRVLLKKGSDPRWTDVYSLDFCKIIDALTSEGKILKYYRPDLDLFIEMDASGKGIGMALLQSDSNERYTLYPIAYGSKTLTSAETRYGNIECELLGVGGCSGEISLFHFWASSDHI